MNIIDDAATIAASTWEQDKTYEQAMLERFYQVRAVEIDEHKAELDYWQARIEQDEVLDASPDPDYSLDDLIDLLWQDEIEKYWYASRL